MYGAERAPTTLPYSSFSITMTATCAGALPCKWAIAAGRDWVGNGEGEDPQPLSTASAHTAAEVDAAALIHLPTFTAQSCLSRERRAKHRLRDSSPTRHQVARPHAKSLSHE